MRTVNVYLNCPGGMFSFAKQNGYIDKNPFEGIDPLRKRKVEPAPIGMNILIFLMLAYLNRYRIYGFWQ
ncbi:hypothetical protein [Kosakonia cowanii]|uniref:hypothetical protein n=1 Tax=Kosakonia cowanii TaxID=208223 RepID=UPI003208911B